MFRAIPFVADEHWEVATRWWREHGWKILPHADQISDTGIVVTYDAKPVAMVWLYKTNSHSCWLHWLVADRHAEKMVRNKAIDHAINACAELAGECGYKYIWSVTQIERSKKRYLDLGFVQKEETTSFVKEL